VRIAVLCTDLGVRVPGEKGASLHLSAIARALARIGNEVMLIGVAGHGRPPGGVSALLLEHPGRSAGVRRELRKLAFVRGVVGRVRQPLAELGPDVVYERLSLFGVAGERLAAAVGARHVVEVNALLAAEEARWRGLRLAAHARRCEDRVLRSASLRVAVSEELAAAVRRLAPGQPTAVLPNGVDAPLFAHLPHRAPARRRLDLPGDRPVLAFAGALRPWHGVDVAIRALPHIEGAVLAVAGDGPIVAGLQRLASREGVAGRVRWLGRLPHDQIPTLLSACDVAVLPYPAVAGFCFSPLKLYEYLAAGVPVAASDIGQPGTLLRQLAADGGLATSSPVRLAAPGDPRALAQAVGELLAAPESRSAAAAVRRRVLAEHSWDQRARELTDLLRKASDGALAA
jgi:glycosyltransferase involved in cell wall biosynthesis